MITPLKGVKWKFNKIPEDEGKEFFDCKGEEVCVALNEADDDPNNEISHGEDNLANNNHIAGEGANTGEDDTTHDELSSVVKLADVCTVMMMMS